MELTAVMKTFIRISFEGLCDMFNGNTDQNDDVPYKEKRRSVIAWFCLLGFCIFMLVLSNNK
jgi:hypothetical protein